MPLSFNSPIYVLAPLAGYTDLPFRSVVKKFGADLTISEMISSNALTHGSKKSIKMLEKNENEDPYAIQIAGAEVSVVKEAVEYLNRQDGIDIIDLNAGCPVPKVVSHGSGSSLLKDLGLFKEIIQTIKVTSNKSMTSVKVRIGFEDKYPTDIAIAAQEAGADFIAIHGRTRAGKFKAAVDYDAIREAKAAVSIPVIANGDITDFDKAKWVLEYTKADGIMIGRGAIGNPWIFYQLKHDTKEVSRDIRREIVLEHYDKMIEFYGERGVAMFRKHLHTYSKGLKGAAAFRQAVNVENDVEKTRTILDSFF